MVRPRFDEQDFFAAALAITAERGPPAVTVGAITEQLGAPVGSFYYRFASRDALLGQLWLRTVLEFQRGVTAALDAGEALSAALHTPRWVRGHLAEGCLLLLYHRDDFVQGDWPEALRAGVAAQAGKMDAGFARFADLAFGCAGDEELRAAQFLLAEVPVAAVRQYLLRRQPPPLIVDELIRITYRAVVEAWRGPRSAAPIDERR